MSLGHGTRWLYKSSLILCLGLIGVGAAWGQGKGNGIEVRSLAPALVAATPGRIVTLTFRITSRQPGVTELGEELELPEGWQAAVPMGTFSLDAGAARVRPVPVSVPRGAAAGEYEITYRARSPQDYAIADSDTARVTVARVSNLTLEVIEKPDFVVAGQALEATLRLSNRGNQTVTVALEATSREPAKPSLSSSTLTLAPNSNATFTAQVPTDPKETVNRGVALQVTATGDARDGDSAPTATATVSTDLIPREGKPVNLQRTYPLRATVTLVGRNGDAQLQGALSGSGFLDEAETRRLDFRLTGPASSNTGFYSQSEMWARYETPDQEFRVGDGTYGLSGLTEYGRYGRGLGLSLGRSGPWRATAYYVQDRNTKGASQMGVGVTHTDGPGNQLQLNFLSKGDGRRDGADKGRADLATVGGNWALGRDHRLGLEIGASSRRNGGSDMAYRLEANGSLGPQAHYSFSKQRAGANYAGYFRDADYTSGGLTASISQRLQVSAAWSQWVTNLNRDPAVGAAPSEQLWQFGLDWGAAGPWSVSAGVEWFRNQDRQPIPEWNVSELIGRVGVGYTRRQLSARLNLERAWVKDQLRGTSTQPTSVDLHVTYAPTEKLAVTAYGQLSDDGSRSQSRLLGARGNVGLGLTWNPSTQFSSNISYVRYGLDSTGRRDDELSVSLRHASKNGSSLSLEIRRNGALIDSDNRDTEYLLVHTMPFDLPLGRRSDVGELTGRVFDADRPGHPGLPNVIVVCGASGAFATKADGSFCFAGLPVGKHQLQVQAATLGAGKVTAEPLPLEVEVRPGQTTQAEIGIIAAGRISGTVMVVPASADSATGTPGAIHRDGTGATLEGATGAAGKAGPRPLGGILVDLVREGPVLRAVTDGSGRYSFDNLRPGSYRLVVHTEGLPEQHVLQQAEQTVEVQSGGQIVVDFPVTPKVRRIRIIDEGTITK